MRLWPWSERGLRAKLLAILLPLVVLPILVLAAVGFVTSSREAAKISKRYLKQRETDLRTMAASPSIPNYFINRAYGLGEEAEVYRQELEATLERFAEQSNSAELIYTRLRYVDPAGREVVAVVPGAPRGAPGDVKAAPFFTAVAALAPGEVYTSPVGPEMLLAMPVHQPGIASRAPVFQGAVVLDFIYPVQEFQRTTAVIAWTFVVITVLSLGVAVWLIVDQVRRLTDPVRRLAEAATRVAAGQRPEAVAHPGRDEIGQLARSFNDMTASLDANEAALRRKAAEGHALYEIGREIIAQVALEPTLRLIVERARELLGGDLCTLALRDAADDTFVIRAHSGEAAEALLRVRFSAGTGVTGRVITTGQPVIVDDYAREHPESPLSDVVTASGIRSALAVPLRSRGSLIGVLVVAGRASARFRAEDQQLLAALADQAAIAIENATLYEASRRYADELEAKVEERTRDLQAANWSLEEASRHKSEFLARMSHELRTPMNAIIGFTRIVMRRSQDVLPEKQYENLEKILVSAEHLLGLINDILDLSKIEAGRMEVHATAFALEPLLAECLRTVEPMVKPERVRLETTVAPDLPALHTDQDKLKQILMNLLSNAAKFTEAGVIRVTARRQDGQLAIEVSDTGIGIPADALEAIFEEFQQVDSGPTRRYGGTGLGLSISRHLARLLGGDILVESAVGTGSTFTLVVPPAHPPLRDGVGLAGQRPAGTAPDGA